jgi:hypothetical protein
VTHYEQVLPNDTFQPRPACGVLTIDTTPLPLTTRCATNTPAPSSPLAHSPLLNVQAAQHQIAMGGLSGKSPRHHIFPQADSLAKFFTRAGINKHAVTAEMDEVIHRALHRGKGSGGNWNSIWDSFRKDNAGGSAFFLAGFGFGLMDALGLDSALVPW